VDSLGLPGLGGEGVAHALVRHTGGNPLFVLETLKQGFVDGSLARGQLPSPRGVGALIDARLRACEAFASCRPEVPTRPAKQLAKPQARTVRSVRSVSLAT